MSTHAAKQFGDSRKITSFHPPQRTLMGPGPSDINPRVLAAMSLPAIGYLDPIFVQMMEELKSLLRYAYQTENALTFPVSGPGSVGMETCFVNAVAPGDKVIVGRNGVFGGRMIENVERAGGVAVVVDSNGESRSIPTRSRMRSSSIRMQNCWPLSMPKHPPAASRTPRHWPRWRENTTR